MQLSGEFCRICQLFTLAVLAPAMGDGPWCWLVHNLAVPELAVIPGALDLPEVQRVE